jgi:hypothetical protein
MTSEVINDSLENDSVTMPHARKQEGIFLAINAQSAPIVRTPSGLNALNSSKRASPVSHSQA